MQVHTINYLTSLLYLWEFILSLILVSIKTDSINAKQCNLYLVRVLQKPLHTDNLIKPYKRLSSTPCP